MRSFHLAVVMIALLLAGSGCRSSREGTADSSASDSARLEARMTRLTAALAYADSESTRSEPVARWLLPAGMAEISGLALTPDGRLFAHNDESARISEIDYRRGTIVKQFSVGKPVLHGDFEGLAYVEDRFFLMSSAGNLYEFNEGAAEDRVEFTMHDTRLGKECEFEGLAYDSTANALILACKQVRTKQSKDQMLLFRYSLGDPVGATVAEIAVPYSEAIGKNGWKELRPSGLTVDPFSGNYVLVAAQAKALVALTPTGEVVLAQPLGGQHSQAEGIAITRDGILIISDESVNSAASITLYRWP